MLQAFKSTDIETRGKVEPITAQALSYLRQGLDVNATVGRYALKTAQTVEAGSTTTRLITTGVGSGLLRGDFVVFTSGSYGGYLCYVSNVSTDYLDLSQALPTAPAVGVTYNVYRVSYLTTDSSGSVSVSVSTPSGLVTYTHTRVVITQHATNDTQVLAANVARKYGYIINRSNYQVDLAYGETAVLGQGTYVYQTGGRFDINTTQEIRGIQNSGSVTLDVYEGT